MAAFKKKIVSVLITVKAKTTSTLYAVLILVALADSALEYAYLRYAQPPKTTVPSCHETWVNVEIQFEQ
jgi:hypothetical protein